VALPNARGRNTLAVTPEISLGWPLHLTVYCQYDSILSMTGATAHLAIYDTLADWEVGYLLVELRTGRFTGAPWNIVTVAEQREPTTTMGGVRILPDMLLDDLDPASSELLILPGADLWDAGDGQPFAKAASRFVDAGVPVAAICGATAGLARAGVLDTRHHTSGAAEYLMATGYAGADYYVNERAVVDGDLITAGPQSPVQFARATLGRLGLASEQTLEAYEALFHRGDPAAFPILMQAQNAA
jgi:putative intracellular protease/amidase